MNISDKIYHYLIIKDMELKDFAEKLQIKRVTISAMLSGKNRFSQDFFEAVAENFPDINLNALVNKNIGFDFLQNDRKENEHSERILHLEESLIEIKKIIANAKI